MKKILGIICFFISVLAVVIISNAQTVNINDLAHQQRVISSCTNDISSCQALITTATAAEAIDNAAIAAYNAANAQTPAQVNWDYIDGLEIAGIRYTQWSATQTGVNWTYIIANLGITCSPNEAGTNWTNMPNCEAKGVAMGQPYGNWTTGMAAFMCGGGSISGVC